MDSTTVSWCCAPQRNQSCSENWLVKLMKCPQPRMSVVGHSAVSLKRQNRRIQPLKGGRGSVFNILWQACEEADSMMTRIWEGYSQKLEDKLFGWNNMKCACVLMSLFIDHKKALMPPTVSPLRACEEEDTLQPQRPTATPGSTAPTATLNSNTRYVHALTTCQHNAKRCRMQWVGGDTCERCCWKVPHDHSKRWKKEVSGICGQAVAERFSKRGVGQNLKKY